MRLLIAILLIYGLNLHWLWYLAAVSVWISSVLFWISIEKYNWDDRW